jgi:hypothetical protein
MTDLIYIEKGLFTTFIPETDQGIELYNQLGDNTTIITIHLKSVLQQIRKAGYSVKKAPKRKPVTQEELNEIFAELEELGL